MADRVDVARLAGVSTATVSRVTSCKGYVKRETREKVIKAIEMLDYRPNALAQNLRLKRNNMIAVMAEDLCNAYTAECVEVLSREARKYGCCIMLFTVNEGNIDAVVDEIVRNKTMGVVNSTMLKISDENRQKLLRAKTRTIGIAENFELDIQIKYEDAMREAYKLLVERNKKRPIYMGGIPMDWLINNTRVKAFLQLNEEFGMIGGLQSVIAGKYPLEKYHIIGYNETNRLFEEGKEFDTVFCLTDSMAMGVLHSLFEHGKKVPQDVAVIGCDNVSSSDLMNPGLTTIDTQEEEVCKEYIRYILSDDQNIVRYYDTKLIIRDTL